MNDDARIRRALQWEQFRPGQGKALCIGDITKDSGLRSGDVSWCSSGYMTCRIEEESKARNYNNDQVLISIDSNRETDTYTVRLVLFKFNSIFQERLAKEDTIKTYDFKESDKNPYKMILTDIREMLGLEQ